MFQSSPPPPDAPRAATSAPTGTEVIEFGPPNASIHKIDECVALADLEPLAEIYREIMKSLLS